MGSGDGSGGCSDTCCAYGRCIRWTTLIFLFIWIIVSIVAIALPGWYAVEVKLSKLEGISIDLPDGTKVTKLENKYFGYGLPWYCQNYAKMKKDGTCDVAPLWYVGNFLMNDQALTLSDGTIAKSTEACCVGYKSTLWVNNSFHLNIGTDVPHTTEGLSVFSLILQIICWLVLIPATCCCTGHISSGCAAFWALLCSFFYMVTAAYWANMQNSKDNVYPTHCSLQKKEYAYTFSAYKQNGMTFEDFVTCGSFASYWCMWVNFVLMLLMTCSLSYSAHKARGAAEAEAGENIPLNTDPGQSYQG